MSEAHSNRPKSQRKLSTPAGVKPEKPRPDFPLFAHPCGYWCKKIDGQHRYFGPWEDPDGALQRYLDSKSEPQADDDGKTLTVDRLCAKFLQFKKDVLESGELSQHTFADHTAPAICSFVQWAEIVPYSRSALRTFKSCGQLPVESHQY
jgi:hypothetical protein